MRIQSLITFQEPERKLSRWRTRICFHTSGRRRIRSWSTSGRVSANIDLTAALSPTVEPDTIRLNSSGTASSARPATSIPTRRSAESMRAGASPSRRRSHEAA